MGSAGMNLLPVPWIWLVLSSCITFGKATDEKTGASDDWGRGHLFRSGRSSNTQIYRKYMTKEMSSNQNYERKSRASRNMEHSLYKKGQVFENDRKFYNQIWKRSGWMKRLFGGKHMMRSAKRKGLISTWQ